MPRMRHDQTLAHAVTLSGNGLHGNRPCTVVLRPAEQATGIVFRHLPSGVDIPARAEFVGDCSLATTLIRDGVRLQTVEHLLSALMGLEIDHLTVDLTGDELPILDGSAGPWVRAIQSAGIRAMASRTRSRRIVRPVEVRQGDKWMRVSPYPGLRVGYTIDFDHPAIGRQTRELTITPSKYVRDLGSARTFCMEQDIEFMRARGLAKGGSLDNAVVFSPQGPLNESRGTGPRHPGQSRRLGLDRWRARGPVPAGVRPRPAGAAALSGLARVHLRNHPCPSTSARLCWVGEPASLHRAGRPVRP